MICLECGKEFTPTMGLNKICSEECRMNRKNRKRRKSKQIRKCIWCEEEFEAADHRKKYCSVKCKRSFQSKFRKDHVLRNRVKRIGFKKLLPNECEICGFSRVIQYAHIVSVKDGGVEERDNLLALCPNHHWLYDHNELYLKEYELISERVNAGKAKYTEYKDPQLSFIT